MKYGVQILIGDEWYWVCPTGGNRYEYSTEAQAQAMMEMCYPDQLREQRLGGKQEVRVKEIKE